MKKGILFILLISVSVFLNSQIISQYVETNDGTTPKGIEIWNNTGSTLDFSVNNLVIEKGTNGGTPSADYSLTAGTLAAGDVIVIGTSNMQTITESNGSTFYTKAFTFNGDDALVVKYGGTTTDVFGDPGTGDPGTGWAGSGVQSYNQNISLKEDITTGDIDGWTDPSDRFELTSDNPVGVDGLSGFGIAPGAGSSVNNPTSFTATASSTSQINLTWIDNDTSDAVMVVYDLDGTFTDPVDSNTYSGSALGGTVIYQGTTEAYNHTSLSTNTAYYYKAWSVDGSNNYSSGVIANATTLNPTISLSTTTLTDFSYAVDNGPSDEQSFTVSGSNLTANITITAPDNYEISTGTGGSFSHTSPITLSQSSGSVAETTIYVRLEAGLSEGDYNDEDVTCSSTGANNKTVTCSGSVTDGSSTTYTEDFDTDGNWTGDFSAYAGDGYYRNDTIDPENDSFTFGTCIRETTAQGGTHSGDYGIRLDDLSSSYFLYECSVNISRITIWIAHWDVSDNMDVYIEYSTDSGSNFTNITTIDETWWTGDGLGDQTYKKYDSGALNISPESAETVQFKIRTDGFERLMLDDFSVTYSTGGGSSVDDPAAFSATASSTTQIDLSATANAAGDNILVAYNSNSTFGEPSGSYTAGNSITGGGTVFYCGSAASLGNHTSLSAGQTVYYKAWSYDGSEYSAGLTDNATTFSPSITVSTATLTDFTYELGNGPSSEQSFTVSGSNLTADITITAPTNYEISTGTGGGFSHTSPLTLTQSGGSVAETTIYVRLKAGLDENYYNNEVITCSSTDADNQTITCSGSVTDNSIVTVSLPYSEDFTGQNGKGAVGNSNDGTTIDLVGVDWSINVGTTLETDTSDNYFYVNGEMFKGIDVDGSAYWYSPTVNVTGVSSIDLSMALAIIGGGANASGENLTVYYTLDPSAETPSYTQIVRYDQDNSTPSNISGYAIDVSSTNEAGIRVEIDSDGASAGYSFDDVSIAESSGTNEAPAIANIAHTPSSNITSSSTVSVSADVTDSDGTISSVELHWGTSSGSLNTTISMSLGTGNTYTTDSDIPAQSAGTTVYYEIAARDNSLATTTTSEQHYSVEYYATCNGLTGDALKAELHDLIDGHTVFSYGGDQANSIMFEADRDPNNSDNLIEIYTGDSENTISSREHVWAKSHGNFVNVNPMYSDLHNLKPCDSVINSTRNSLDFDDGGSEVTGAPGNYKDGDSWEPRDAVKGDVARIIFYMAVRYEGDNGEYDLEVVNGVDTDNPDTGTYGEHGNLAALLQWHEDDPVDSFESNRNDVIFNNQGNRNPFIDHPEYVGYIWEGESPDLLVPTATAATDITESSFYANWNASANATGYYLDVATDSGFTSFVDGYNNLNVNNVTTYQITGLSINTNYYYRVRAYDTETTTTSSSTISVTTDSDIPDGTALFISEVADQDDVYQCRFVEIFNNSNRDIDFSSETWYMCRQTNGGSWEDNQLTGNILLENAYVCANENNNTSDDFYLNYGFMADFDFGGSSGNGDDGYFLYYGGDHSTGTLVDAYGVIDENGAGQDWDYEDKIVTRNSDIEAANTTWSASEWTFTDPGNVADATPGTHTIGNATHHGHAMTNEQTHTFPSNNSGQQLEFTIASGASGNVQVNVATYNQSYQGVNNTYEAWWDISVDQTGLTTTLEFGYLEDNLNGIAEGQLVIYHKNGSSWENLGGVVDVDNNKITLSNYTGSFSPFTLGREGDSPLPVTLSSFSASFVSNQASVLWTTMSETNNAGWNIYRSESDQIYESMQINPQMIEGQGNTTEQTRYSFEDEYPLENGITYNYWLESISTTGDTEQFGPVCLAVPNEGNDQSPQVPEAYGLHANYPNPFNPETTISYNLKDNSHVNLSVYNIKGELVKVLVNENSDSGHHQVVWNGTDRMNREVGSGIYMYKLSTEWNVESRLMMLIK